ncbi:MAG: PAS domain S-box protein [Desulfomonilia bacterium]
MSDRLLERLGLGVVRIDRELRIISLGNAARRILKLPEEDLRGRSLREVLPEPLFKEVYSAVRRSLRQDSLVSLPVRGAVFGQPLFIRCVPSRGGAAVTFESMGAARPLEFLRQDLERQELERLYEQMESELITLEAVLEQLPSGVTIEEAPSGRLLYHNAQADRMLGHPAIAARDYRGQERYGAIHKDGTMYRPGDYPIARALKGEYISQEDMLYRRGDGGLIHLSLSAAPVKDLDGAIVAAVCVLNDITDRKLAQDALRESEEKLRNIVENSTNVFYSHTPEGRLTYLSPQFEKIFGYSPREGKLLWMDTLTDNPANQRAIEATRQAILTGKPQPTYEMELKTGSGGTIWVEVNESPVVRDGKTVMIVGALQDITERKRAEKQRMEMERRFQQAQKFESLGVMAGGIAHDFNNLLTAILGNLDLALMKPPGSPGSRAFIEQARTATMRASELTGQMLAYTGKGRFHVKTFNLSELVEEMASLLRASISKTVVLNLDMDRSIPEITADPAQIQQIIMNLIVNASEAIGNRPGIITIKTAAMHCDESCFEQSRIRRRPTPGLYVLLEVRDTGCGMDEQTLERIFDPFFTTKFTGRGLGMAAVLGIVEGHGGAIMTESEPGRGTSIRVMLPAGAPAGKAALREGGHPGRDVAPGASSGTVLVVDDEGMVLELCAALVEQLGFQPLKASSGREALELFRGHAQEVSLVILDLTMPEMGGVEALHEIRRIRSDARVLVSSGYSEQETSKQFGEDQPDGFISKPFTLSGLSEKIGSVLAGK